MSNYFKCEYSGEVLPFNDQTVTLNVRNMEFHFKDKASLDLFIERMKLVANGGTQA